MKSVYRMLTPQEVPANSFRAAVIGFSAFATWENALYISLDSTSLGVPLALCRVFNDQVAIALILVCTLS